jgi:phosphatidate cytidylyltransferase
MAQAPQASRWPDLGVRALSAAVLVPAVIAVVWAGGAWFSLLVALTAIMMAQEWTAIALKRSSLHFALHAAGALCGALLPQSAGLGPAAVAIAALWGLQAALAWSEDRRGAAWRYLGVPYVAIPAMALVQLRHDGAMGFSAIVWVLVIVWAADILAYFAGRIVGGPKLAPRVSPNKTWAGLGGAVLGSALAAALYALVGGLPGTLWLAILAGALGLVEQGGDLFKSALKRHYGLKDSGDLIPGHGGMIDRVDGLAAVATAAALIGLLRGGRDATGSGLLAW